MEMKAAILPRHNLSLKQGHWYFRRSGQNAVSRLERSRSDVLQRSSEDNHVIDPTAPSILATATS